MDRLTRMSDLLERVGPTSRRGFLKRAVVMGAALPLAGSVLSACGGDDDDDTPAATATTADAAEPTADTSGEATEEPAAEATEEPAAEATEEPAAEATESTGGEGKQGGMLIVMGHEGVDGLSPDYIGPTVNWACITQIHNALTEMDPWFEYQPTLAESYEISDDGTVYTFKLRSDVPFHDGETFSAEDVVYTFEYYGNPDNAMTTGSRFVGITSVEAPDDMTVVVSLDAPNAAFLTKAGSSFIVPKHVHEPIGDAEYSTNPVGTGPFKMKDYDPASFVELEAFEDHFRGRPLLDGYRLNTVPEPSVRAIALETGEADSSVWSLNTDDNIRLRDSGNFYVSITSSTACNNFQINTTSDQFKDKVVRQAMMFALDRDTIVNDIWRGLAVKATTNLSPAVAYYHDDTDVMKYDYDPDTANQMLDEAGWTMGSDGVREKDGVRLEWKCGMISGDQARRPIVEAFQQWVTQVGGKFDIVESTAMTEDVRSNKLQMGMHNWTWGGSGGDPDATAVMHSDWSGVSLGTHYSNPEMDQLLEDGLAEPDPEKRKVIYKRVQEIFCEDVPILFVQYWDWFVFFTTRVKGLPEEPLLSGSQVYNMAYKMWIEEA
ncbi:MAG: ABC transporter substrate-binding protein [Thermomicrobiales bacterium]|nr:ABC transporter substrate-binding protein [Thermomicrobiales bacterium]